MTTKSDKSDNKKPVINKPASPFSNDPYNNRGGKGGNRTAAFSGNSNKMKSVSVPKFKGGSGGDR